jgi:hypothetical protein
VIRAAILAALIAIPACAPQATRPAPHVEFVVRGTVVDAATGAALPGSHVMIEGTEVKAPTTATGDFELRGRGTRGRYRLLVSRIGYESERPGFRMGRSETVVVDTVRMRAVSIRGHF